MEFLIGLAIVILLAGPVALIGMFVLFGRLRRVNTDLEALKGRLGSAQSPTESREHRPVAQRRESTATAREPAGTTFGQEPVSPPPLPSPASEATGSTPGDIESIIGGQWLTWIGVLAIFFGTAFFLAIDLGTHPFGGFGQVVIGMLVGGVFLVVGNLLSQRRERVLGLGLLGGGIALLFLAAYATAGFHQLVPAAMAYLFLFVVALAGSFVSLRQDSAIVASLTLTGALLTPLFLPLEGEAAAPFFPYLITVNAGTALMASRRGWRALPIAAFVGTVILVLRWWDVSFSIDTRSTAVLGITGLWLVFLFLPLVARTPNRTWDVARSAVVFANALGYEFFLHTWLSPDYEPFRGTAAAALALAYVAAGALAALRNRPLARPTHYAGIVLGMLAIPIQFDLAVVSLSWAAMAFVLVLQGARTDDRGHRLLGLALLCFDLGHVLIFNGIESLERRSALRPILNADFISGLGIVAGMVASARVYSTIRDRISPIERRIITPIFIGAALVFFFVISFETIRFFEVREADRGISLDLPAHLTLSMVWAGYGALLIAAGFIFRYRPIRLTGVALLLLATGKVFLHDLQAMERGYRIASFAGLGVLLLVISILYQRRRR